MEGLNGAYAWIDPEGRNVLFLAVIHARPQGGRNEGVSLIGIDTKWALYLIDGGTNDQRFGDGRAFYSSPMWMFEKDRKVILDHPNASGIGNAYLPVTKNHDVLALFGSSSKDYSEVDLGDLTDPFNMLFLPMNELVFQNGLYDLTRTPDLSGFFSTGQLVGSATISTSSKNASAPSGSLLEPHAKGRVLLLNGNGGVVVDLNPATPGVGSALDAWSLQFAVRPFKDGAMNCSKGYIQYVIHIPGSMSVVYNASSQTLSCALRTSAGLSRFGWSPALQADNWTHVAFSWDGIEGSLSLYMHGRRTDKMYSEAGAKVLLATQKVYVGTSNSTTLERRSVCGGLVGAIDEVRLFSHARSGRSICLTTIGADCIEEAIQDEPSAGQYLLSHQSPKCTGRDAVGSVHCASALHRVCAQQGASNVLSSATNFLRAVRQLIGGRPPVSMAGVVVDESSGSATVACTPLPQETVSITFAELARDYEAACVDERVVSSISCLTASMRLCNDLGWTTGKVFEVTSQAWVVCFIADYIEFVSGTEVGGGCSTGDWESSECMFGVSSWCRRQGYDAGLIQRQTQTDEKAQVHCFYSNSESQFSFMP